jgi:colanic acid biosynthesis protein WcaH
LAAAFRRVSLAELGVEKKMEEARFLGVYEHFYSTNNLEQPGFGTHYILLTYEVTSLVPEASLPKDQHAEYFWLTEADILTCPEVHEHSKAYFR